MARFLKISLLSLLALVLLVVAALVVAINVIDPNDFKPEIEAQVENNTGLKLDINGELGWSLYPWIGVEIGDVKLYEPDNRLFAGLQQLQARVKLLSLLRLNPEVDNLVVAGLELNLRKAKNGAANWELATSQPQAAAPASSAPANTAPATQPAAPDTANNTPAAASGESGRTINFAVAGVSVTDAAIQYVDETTGQAIALSDFNLTSSNIQLGQPFRTRASFALKGDNPALDMSGELDTRVLIQPGFTQYAVPALAFKGDIRYTDPATQQQVDLQAIEFSADGFTVGDTFPDELDFNLASLSLNGNVTLDDPANEQRVTLSNIDLDTRDVQLGKPFPITLGARIQTLNPGFDVTSNISTSIGLEPGFTRFDIPQLEVKAAIKGEPFAGETVDVSLNTGITVDLDQQQVAIKQLVALVESLTLRSDLNIAQFDTPRINGTLKTDTFSVKELMRQLGQEPIETAEAGALNSVSVDTRIAGPANQVHLNDLTIKLDDTDILGAVQYHLANGYIKADLNGSEINVDRYLPPPDPAAAALGTPSAVQPRAIFVSTQATAEPDLLPLDTLRGLNFDATVDWQKLITQDIAIDNIKLRASGKNGLIDLKQASGEVFNGTFNATGQIDARGDTPTMAINKTIRGVESSFALEQFATMNYSVSGALNADANITTRGNTLTAVQNNLRGPVSFNIANGVFEGFNLTAQACRGIASLNNEPIDTSAWPNRTTFNNLSGSARLNGLAIQNDSLVLNVAGGKISGNGLIDVGAERLDYGIQMEVVGDTSTDACVVRERFRNLPLPLRCKGSFHANPATLCGPDLAKFKDLAIAFAKKEAQRKVEKEVDKALDKGLNKLLEKGGEDDESTKAIKDGVKNLLKGFGL